ncbi:hypothetical protein HMI55_003333, partial [Coelomomyces lativittatus]
MTSPELKVPSEDESDLEILSPLKKEDTFKHFPFKPSYPHRFSSNTLRIENSQLQPPSRWTWTHPSSFKYLEHDSNATQKRNITHSHPHINEKIPSSSSKSVSVSSSSVPLVIVTSDDENEKVNLSNFEKNSWLGTSSKSISLLNTPPFKKTRLPASSSSSSSSTLKSTKKGSVGPSKSTSKPSRSKKGSHVLPVDDTKLQHTLPFSSSSSSTSKTFDVSSHDLTHGVTSTSLSNTLGHSPTEPLYPSGFIPLSKSPFQFELLHQFGSSDLLQSSSDLSKLSTASTKKKFIKKKWGRSRFIRKKKKSQS